MSAAKDKGIQVWTEDEFVAAVSGGGKKAAPAKAAPAKAKAAPAKGKRKAADTHALMHGAIHGLAWYIHTHAHVCAFYHVNVHACTHRYA